MKRAKLCIVTALCAPLALGCGAAATIGAILAKPVVALLPEPIPSFEDAATAYNNDLRWGRVRQAVAQVAPDQQEAFLVLFEDDVTPYQFTSAELVTAQPKAFAEDGKTPVEFDVLAAYEYYRPPVVVERRVRQRQTWRFVAAEKRWVVAPDLSVFEPPPPAAPAR